jgi:tRNA A-37 threonylcarbamoyl transferase component Bud32
MGHLAHQVKTFIGAVVFAFRFACSCELPKHHPRNHTKSHEQIRLVWLRGSSSTASRSLKRHYRLALASARQVSVSPRKARGRFPNLPSLTVGLPTRIQLTAPEQNPILPTRNQPAMRECPRCERCFEDDAVLCPDDQSKTKITLPGTTLLNGRYRLGKRLGRGAMGQVYLARDENLITRRVAVKTIRPDVLSDEDLQEGEAIARFEREARTAASIQHPNVIDVTDFGKSEEGVFFLVMEYVEGESLYQLLRREGTVTVQRALALLRQISAGVEAAHDEGILHRDLKPANVFIVQRKKKDGTVAGGDIVKVGDFGLAKIISQSLSGLTSGSGPASRGILGTPEYMAPEQMQAGVTLDARADVYALGAMAYHMLGGRPPFTGDIMQIFAQKLTQ